MQLLGEILADAARKKIKGKKEPKDPKVDDTESEHEPSSSSFILEHSCESTHQSANPALSLCYVLPYGKPWSQSPNFTMGVMNKPWTTFSSDKALLTAPREAEPWFRPEFLADVRHGVYYKPYRVSSYQFNTLIGPH